MNAAFAQYRRQRKANVFDAFDVIMVGRDVENRIFIVGNGAANAAQCSGNAVESGPFAVDNLIGGIADAVIDLSFNIRSERFAEFFPSLSSETVPASPADQTSTSLSPCSPITLA